MEGREKCLCAFYGERELLRIPTMRNHQDLLCPRTLSWLSVLDTWTPRRLQFLLQGVRVCHTR